MKRFISVILSVSLMFSLSAFAVDSTVVEKTVRTLGIINGDENGNLNLSRPVTRAEFAKMLCAASVYKNEASASASSFKDVKYTHWASGYIKTAAANGWVTGYLDGTFRPDNTITFEEAASATLKLLGYTAADYTGTFPQAQISKFRSLRLDSGISLSQGQQLTRYNCMYIFYNLMGAIAKDGKAHAVSLGYSITSSGEIDYESLLKSDMSGPFVNSGTSWAQGLPFDAAEAEIYKNGILVSAASITDYDVYYYNRDIRTIWVYSNRAVGLITAVSPNNVSPTSVTVAGMNYNLGASAVGKLSATGSFKTGDSVALLLGMDGEAVDVIPAKYADGIYYGVVVSSGTQAYSAGKTEYFVSVACTDGNVRSFVCPDGSFSAGAAVSAGYTSGEPWVKGLTVRGFEGSVTNDGKRIGNYTFADDVEILEYTSNGDYKIIFPVRLAGAQLKSGDIKYYSLDSNGRLNRMVLFDTTGDLCKYGVLTNASETQDGMSVSGSYDYIINGTSGSYRSTSSLFGAGTGPAIFRYTKNNTISSIKNLTSVSISEITATYIMSGTKKYILSDDVQIYLRTNSGYTKIDWDTISGGSAYRLSGYYETGFSAGGVIRIIIAANG